MKRALFVVPLLLLLFGCGNTSSDDGGSSALEEEPAVQYGTVLFFNESSYAVSVHADAFSGAVLAELASGESKSVSVRPSDNYGIGSVFAIGFRTKIMDGFNLSCGEIYAYGIDPNMQFSADV